MRSHAITVMLLAVIAASDGCAVRTPAAPDRAQTLVTSDLPSEVWPQPRAELLLQFLKEETIRIDAGCDEPNELFWSPATTRLIGRLAPFICRGAVSGAVIFEPWPKQDEHQAFRILVNHLDENALAQFRKRADELEFDKKKLLRFTCRYDPSTHDDQSRGLVVHLVSIGNRKFENRVMQSLREYGWAVLEIVPDGYTIAMTNDEWSYDDHRKPDVIAPDRLAANIDRNIGDTAIAVDAALTQLRDCNIIAPSTRIVIVGFSLGALVAPATAARLHNDVKALVLVGGGANVAGIVMRGALLSSASKTLRRSLDDSQRAAYNELPDRYLAESALDAFHTAPYLRCIPTLLIEGRFDAVIPARNRQLLYDRLDQPERWVFPLGHAGLFWWLPNEADNIARWIEQNAHQ